MSAFEVNTVQPGHQQLDDNEEHVIVKGICAQKTLKEHVSWYYKSNSCSFCHICLPCCLLVGRWCGSKAVNIWHMYLTPTTLHIVNFSPHCVCWPKSEVDIALTDIKEIEEVGAIYKVWGSCLCFSEGTKLIPPSTVRIQLKPNKAKDFFCCCLRRCDLPIVIDINYCENATEFVEAVRQRMNIERE